MDNRNGSYGYRIDDRIVFTMTGMIVLSLLVLGFRFRNTEPCMEVKVKVKAPHYYPGYLVSFRADAVGGKSYAWDFNDGKTYESNITSVQHAFAAPGTYFVSVVVNGHCEGFDTVTIVEPPLPKTPVQEPSFVAPDTATVNRPVTFIDTTSDAKTWKWRCGESEIVDGQSQKISYTYKSPGVKFIYLEINGRPDRTSMRTIYVKDEQPLVPKDLPQPRSNEHNPMRRAPIIAPKPTGPALGGGPAQGGNITPPPKPKVYTDVQADEVIILLQGVVTGEKKAADFTQYFCDELDIPVTYNGTPMKFSQMCNILRAIKKLKKIKKPEVQLIKNSSTNCINRMVVTVGKADFFERHF